MIVKGKRTWAEYHDVEIDTSKVLENIYYHSTPRGLSHLSDDGHWYKVSGHDYHKNEELYDKDRLATPEEIEMKKAYRILRKYVTENKL